jgi:myo-inositol-1(or 4)-monophosphatase
VNATDLLVIARDLAIRVGDIALAGRRKGLTQVDTKSTTTDMVTEYDRSTEQEIVSTLRRLRPDDSIVGEEGGGHDGTSGITWYIDPIDGTTNFLYDLPMWAVSIGAHDADGPLCGVVYAPALRETFTAIRGNGAHLNGRSISCGSVTELPQALIATGFNYSPANRLVQAARFPHIIDKIRDVRRFGAASLDLCFVACGRYDAYFEEHLFPWDTAAGALIASEAGAVVGSPDGREIDRSAILASNSALFTQIQDLLFRANSM